MLVAGGAAIVAAAWLASAGPASAENPPAAPAPAPGSPAPVGPPAVSSSSIARAETPSDTTLRESLRPDLAPPPSGREFEKMPDGSVRYGNLRLRGNVNAECPDDPFHEAPPLPRRGR